MTYQPPSHPGYPAPQQNSGYGAPAAPPAVQPAGPSKLPSYLTVSVAVLGLLAYLFSFGPLFNINTNLGPFGGAELTASGMGYWTIAALIAALLAIVGLIAKNTTYTPAMTVAAVLGVLLVIGQVLNRPSTISIGWALWVVLLLTLAQAAAAIAALLYENGVLTPPAPRPRYDQYGTYGPPPVGYYGQPGGPTPGYPAPQQAAGGYAPRGYGQADANLDTPPTGFPSLGTQQSPTVQPSDPSGQAQS